MSRGNIVFRFIGAIWRGLMGLRKVLHLFLLLFIFLIIFGALSGGTPQLMPQKAALIVQPAGALVEQYSGDPYERAIAELMGDSQPQTLVQDIVDALDKAKYDDRITAVHLELSALGSSGLDKLHRIAAAIDSFKESGKPVVATADFLTQQGYYLAVRADELYLNPDGVVFLQGYGAYRTYYKDAIDLLRIDWNVFRVGTHKAAYEPYTRMDMSPEDRESRAHLLDSLWGSYRTDVVEARGLPEGAVADYADNLVAHTQAAGGDMAVMARDRGLVDELLGRTDIRNLMIEHVGPADDDETTYGCIDVGLPFSRPAAIGRQGQLAERCRHCGIGRNSRWCTTARIDRRRLDGRIVEEGARRRFG